MSVARKSNKHHKQVDFFIPETRQNENDCWSSNLFHDVFLRNDMKNYFEEFDIIHEGNGYDRFLESFRSFVLRIPESIKGEDNTIRAIILPMMEELGWTKSDPKSKYRKNYGMKLNISNDNGERGELDLYFTEDFAEAEEVERHRGKLNDAYYAAKSNAIFNVEAKEWGKLTRYKVGNEYELSREEIRDIRGSALTPPEQAFKYMQMLGHDFTIVTDGKTWQLQNRIASSENNKRCYEFDLGKLIDSTRQLFEDESNDLITWAYIEEQAKYFYYMFAKESLVSNKADKESPIAKLLKESSKYTTEVQEDLKYRFLNSMNIISNAYGLKMQEDGFDLSVKENRKRIRNTGENFLFTLLFIKSLEARGIINPYTPGYENEHSLTYVVNSLDPRYSGYDPQAGDEFKEAKLRKSIFTKEHGFDVEYSNEGCELYDRILRLIDIVEKGKFGFSINTFTKTIFSSQEKKLLKKYKVSNKDMVNIIFNLGFTENKTLKNIREKFSQIPYAYFSPRELGSIYESFLENQLEFASKNCFFNKKKKQWDDINISLAEFCSKNKISKDNVIRKGELYFKPDNKDRKMTGSYYTPDYIVRYIIEDAVGPLCDQRSSKEILKLKICDPAMGSGHFLLDSLIYITNRYRQKLVDEMKLDESYGRSLKTVLQHCIYGVDVNPSAVKLAYMSLWLSTASKNMKLEELDDQLMVGNSLLTFNWEKSFPRVFKSGGFDAIVGNPPYARIQTLRNYHAEDLKKMKLHFKSAEFGNFDLYTLFFEKGYKLLCNNGNLSFITPNTYRMADFGVGLRSFLSSESCLSKIVDFRQLQLFEGASTYSCITTLKRNSSEKFDFFELKKSDLAREDFERFKLGIDESKYFNKKELNIPISNFDWNFSASGMKEIIGRMQKNEKTLEHVLEKIYVGTQTGADKIYVLDFVGETKKYYHCHSNSLGREVVLEKDLCRKFFLGKDISRYKKPEAKRILLFPYSKDNKGEYKLVSLNEMKKKFPESYKYLFENKDVLEKREKGRFSVKEFYQYSRPQSINEFEKGPKLLMRNFSLQSQLTFEQDGKDFFTPNIYGLRFKKKNELYYYYAILNSTLCWAYIKTVSPGLRGGFHQYKAKYIKPFPVVEYEMAFKSNKDLVLEIETLSKQINDNFCLKEFDKLDLLIFKLYGLSREDIRIVKGFSFEGE